MKVKYSASASYIFVVLATLSSVCSVRAQNAPIIVSPTELVFSVQSGSGISTPQNLVVVASGSASVSFTAAAVSTSNWLIVSNTTGTTPQVLTVSVNPGSLASGSYGGFITVTAGSSSSTIPVVLNVNTSGVSPLSASPNPLTFTFQAGSNIPQTQSLNVFLSAGGSTAVTATPTTSDNGTWLSVNPGSGVSPALFNVSVNPSTLSAGSFAGAIAINAPGTTGLVVPVIVNVASTSALNVSPQQLSFAFQTGNTAPPAQNLTLTTVGNNAISFAASASFPINNSCGTTWLVISPQSSSTPGNLSVQINPVGLQPGNCSGTIDISAPGATNPSQSIPVSLLVSATPLLQVPGTETTFTYQLGTATPASQTVQVTSSGAPLNFTASATPVSSGPAFLNVTPTSGTTPQALTLAINPAVLSGLAPNTYAENVSISATGSGNSPQTFTVTLVVSNNPMLVSSPSSAIFNFQIGHASPASQVITLTSTGGPLNYKVGATSTNCNSFLLATPSSGITATQTGQASTVMLSVNTSGLTMPQTCTGTVTISVPGSGAPSLSLPVTLNVSNTPLINLSPAAIKVTAVAGAAATSQIIALTSTDTTTPLNFSATATTTPPGLTWLSVTPNNGTSPANLMVTINPANLSPGVYNGSILVTSTSPNVLAQTIPVQLTVASSTITVSPASLTFNQPVGGPAPASQTLQVTGVPTGATVGATRTLFNGSNWLTVSSTGTSITVSADGSQLTQGSYGGVVTIFVPGASNSPFNVPVTLNVGASQTFTLTQTSLNFTIVAGAISLPGPQTVQLAAPGGSVQFNAVVIAPPGTTSMPLFVTVSPASGTAPATLTIGLIQSVVSTLTPGTYTNLVNLSSTSAPGSSQSILVTLAVTTPGPPTITAVVSGATFLAGAVSPGEIITIFGDNIGPLMPAGLQLTSSGFVSTTLAGTTVSFNGVLAPLIYVSPGQINAIVPYEVSGRMTTDVVVERTGEFAGTSASVQVNVAKTAPGIFTINQTGTGQGAILNANASVNGPNDPASRGSVIVIYATGEGIVQPPALTGSVTPSSGPISSFPKPVAPVSLTIGGSDAQILFAGEAPGLVSGVIQINAVVPTGIGTGNQKLVLTIGDNKTTADVTAAIN